MWSFELIVGRPLAFPHERIAKSVCSSCSILMGCRVHFICEKRELWQTLRCNKRGWIEVVDCTL
jgi:hypothetical protein